MMNTKRQTTSTITSRTTVALILIVAGLCSPALAANEPRRPQIIEKLGQSIPLDLVFDDEQGKPVVLKDIINKPTVLTLVYYRCPNICSPLLRGLASVVDKCDLTPGTDYDLLTISFDVKEGPDLSQRAGSAVRNSLENKSLRPEHWRFMTGKAEDIKRMTDAVGFEFVPVEGGDFDHPTVVIFLSKDGRIIRYLNGLEFLPADMKMAVIDASEGRIRNVMRKLQRLCYSYDEQRRTYKLKINRIILLGTLFFVAMFGAFLLIRGRVRHKQGKSRP